MQQQLPIDVSLLTDSEFEGETADTALARVQGSAEERARWLLYHLIGDVLRGDCPVAGNCAAFMARFSRRLQDELPVATAIAARRTFGVTQPESRESRGVVSKSALAVAAALAGIMVTGLASLSLSPAGQISFAALPSSALDGAPLPPAIAREYLLAHEGAARVATLTSVNPRIKSLAMAVTPVEDEAK